MEAKKRRKPQALRKEDSIRVRVSATQKKVLTEAAERAGLGVSSWLLSLGLREVEAALERRGSVTKKGS